MSIVLNGQNNTLGSWISGTCRVLIFSLDKALRRRGGIISFADADHNLLRLAVRIWDEPTRIVDGTVLEPGKPIIDLHLWNERFSGLGPFGPGLAWGARVRRHVECSFALLAAQMNSDPNLARCAAIRAEIVFPDCRTAAKFARVAERFGLVPCGDAPEAGIGRSMLTLALIWAANPRSLSGKRLRPGRAVYWVSVCHFRQYTHMRPQS